jgi:hypothetical protein
VMRPGTGWSRPHSLGRGQLGSSASIVGGRGLVVWTGTAVGTNQRSDLQYVRFAWWSASAGWRKSHTVGRFHLPGEVRTALTGPRTGAITLTTAAADLLTLRVANGRIGRPQTLNGSAPAHAVVCAAPGGPVAVTWDSGGAVFVRTRAVSGAWTASRQLTTDGNFPTCAAASPTRVLVGWIGDRSGLAQVATRSDTNTWSPTVTLSAGGVEPAVRISVALAPTGASSAAWLFSPPGSASAGVAVATGAAGGGWSSPYTAAVNNSAAPAAAVEDDGASSVIWPYRGLISLLTSTP